MFSLFAHGIMHQLPPDAKIGVLCQTHGNELLGEGLHNRLQKEPLKNVYSRIAHPVAAGQYKRYLGIEQLMARYPGDPFGDEEEQAAHENMLWLGPHAESSKTRIYDIHNTAIPGLEYFEVGSYALKATVVGAYLLGFKNCMVQPCSFYESVRNAAALEASLRSPAEYDESVDRLHVGLGKLATFDSAELQAQYQDILPKLSFWQRQDVDTLTPAGAMLSFLPDLEAIHVEQAFTPLDLFDDLRRALAIGPDDEVIALSWGHKNMSRQRPDLGAADDGTIRRESFGALAHRIAPPALDGPWVKFPDAPRPHM